MKVKCEDCKYYWRVKGYNPKELCKAPGNTELDMRGLEYYINTPRKLNGDGTCEWFREIEKK